MRPTNIPEEITQLPPHDQQNEAAALGCVLLDSSCLDELLAASNGARDFFYDIRNRAILEAFRKLREDGQPISILTLFTTLNESGQLNAAGGNLYLAGLPDATPSAAHLGYCLDRLRSAFIRRRMIIACQEAASQAYEHAGDAEELVTAFREKIREAESILEAKEPRTAKAVLQRCLDRYERMVRGEDSGLPTGFLPIDMQGGLFPGELVLVCGETGLGKSTLALNLIHTTLRAFPVALFSLEMTDGAWMDRLLSLDLGIDRRTFRTRSMFTQGVLERIAGSVSRIAKLPLWICDDPHSTVDDIRQSSRQLALKHGVRLIVIDYAQIVTPPRGVDSREQQVAFIGRNMRAIAQETGCVVVLISQLNDDGKVRESRALLHEAHLCLTLQTRNEQLWLACTKGRDVHFADFPVHFDPLVCRLTQANQMEDR